MILLWHMVLDERQWLELFVGESKLGIRENGCFARRWENRGWNIHVAKLENKCILYEYGERGPDRGSSIITHNLGYSHKGNYTGSRVATVDLDS